MAASRILIVTTSHSQTGDTGQRTGLWAEELATRLGGNWTAAPDRQPHVERDGSLITGQNPQSSELVARQILEALRAPPGRDRT